jgi:hypothetical protein
MRAKGFPLFLTLVILTAPAGCDNVDWEGMEFGLQPPPPSPLTPETPQPEVEAEAALEPVELGPLLYLVEHDGSGEARLLPVAELDEDGYTPLPSPDELEDLVERFSLERWDEGSRFAVFHLGQRVGTFTSAGSTEADERFCLVRPVGSGMVELRPAAAATQRFLALRVDDLESEPSALASLPSTPPGGTLTSASTSAATNLIATMEIPWPTSIPGIRERLDPLVDGHGRAALAATFVFGDELEVGSAPSTAYSLFLVATEVEEGNWRPTFSWYQRQASGGKAFPGFMAAHDVRDVGVPDLVLEVFGQEERSLAILGWEGDEPRLVYQDPCGSGPGPGAFRFHL